MKLKVLALNLLISTILFASCGEANVEGKHFQNEQYPLSIDFAEKTNKVFYLTSVDNYRIEKTDIIVNHNGKDIRLTLKGKTLFVYAFDDSGNQIKNIDANSFSFVEKGTSDFFTNVFTGTEKTVNGIKISYTETNAKIGEFLINYNFNPETGLYTVEGYDGTFDRSLFVENTFNQLINSAVNNSRPLLTYKDAFWSRQNIGNNGLNDELITIYLMANYSEEYNNVKNDEFALHKLKESKKNEIQNTLNEYKGGDTYNLIQTAKLGKYDFNSKSYFVKTSLDFPNLKSTFNGCEYPIEIRLGNVSRNGLNWYSDINTEIQLPVAEDAAEKLKNISDCVIVYSIKPYMRFEYNQTRDEVTYDRWGDPVRAKYLIYYQVVTADLYNSADLSKLGSLNIRKTW